MWYHLLCHHYVNCIILDCLPIFLYNLSKSKFLVGKHCNVRESTLWAFNEICFLKSWLMSIWEKFLFSSSNFHFHKNSSCQPFFEKIDFWTLTEWMKTKLISIVNNEHASSLKKRESNIPSGFVTESLYFSSPISILKLFKIKAANCNNVETYLSSRHKKLNLVKNEWMWHKWWSYNFILIYYSWISGPKIQL